MVNEFHFEIPFGATASVEHIEYWNGIYLNLINLIICSHRARTLTIRTHERIIIYFMISIIIYVYADAHTKLWRHYGTIKHRNEEMIICFGAISMIVKIIIADSRYSKNWSCLLHLTFFAYLILFTFYVLRN